jgi:FKBP-type peptidyl-prolyl cis-trans isomerase FkpA
MEFDNSYNRGQPLTYPMNKVVPGWTEGLQLMSIGSKYKFYIPYQLGYGIYGNEPTIPGGSMLIFEIEMLDIKKYKAPGGQ